MMKKSRRRWRKNKMKIWTKRRKPLRRMTKMTDADEDDMWIEDEMRIRMEEDEMGIRM